MGAEWRWFIVIGYTAYASLARIALSNERNRWVKSRATRQILLKYATDMNEREGVSRSPLALPMDSASEHN